MRRQFAEKANSVGPWIERQMDAVASIAMGMQVRILLIFSTTDSFDVKLNQLSIAGFSRRSVGAFEGVRAERLRLQIAHGRIGEAQSGHSRIDGL